MSMIGKTLGTFTLEALIGKGGMGEVYRAKDQKLGRDVAIKVLPEEFAKDADRVARFQREAKLLASLNHPNIAAIHGLEESDGTHFLVLELIEGDTLADRLKRGAIPVEESLKLALQIAEALEAAHEKGVIHRDLKPANIKVTPDGKVKVLDFGLAKAFAGEQGDMNLSNSPTLSQAATIQGVILGTAAYMSPEQARGKEVDKRVDVWAFGVVLFEMLTGQSLFSGEDVSSTLARVLEREPDFSALPRNLHTRIRFLLERCLKKELKNRCSGISDARVDIQEVLADPNGIFVQPVAAVEPRKKLRTTLLWAASLVLIAMVAGIAVWNLRVPEPKQVTSFEYELPEDQGFGIAASRAFAISPDGSQFVYATRQGLYLRSMAELSARPIVESEENAQNPFFSPDGQWIGYLSESAIGGKLKKVSVNGGAPISIADVTDIYGYLSWCEDNTIVYASGMGGNIMRISANGGDPELLVEGNGQTLIAPQILPDGETIMFTVYPAPGKIMLHSLKTGEQKELIDGNTAQYLPTGHIVYVNEGNLFAVRFDLDRLETIGGPISMIEGINHGFTAPQYAVSNSGTLIYVPERSMENITSLFLGRRARRELVWVDRQGKEEPIAADPNSYNRPQISPDGTKVALSVVTEEGSSDIWIWDLRSELMNRLTFNENSTSPLWSPDGQRIVFGAGDEDERGIYWKKADGTGKDELLGLESDVGTPLFWSGEGKALITVKQKGAPNFPQMMSGRGQAPKRSPSSEGPSTNEETGIGIGSVSMEGEHEWKQLSTLESGGFSFQISPDGRWVAYTSIDLTSESDTPSQVYVRPFPDLDQGQWQVSTEGGLNPLWSPDGRELFYTSSRSLIAVEVETEPTFKLGKSKALFNMRDMRRSVSDISLDGKRFLMLQTPAAAAAKSAEEEPAAAPQPKIIIVLNWFEELKERVPTN